MRTRCFGVAALLAVGSACGGEDVAQQTFDSSSSNASGTGAMGGSGPTGPGGGGQGGGCAIDTDCEDGLFCTVNEQCSMGECQPGQPRDVDDGVACTDDVCDEANEAEVHTPNDGNCNDSVTCTADSCDAVNDCVFTPTNANCNDNVACTADSCDAVNDCVFTPTNANCDDNVACTVDTCDAVNGCVFTPTNANCNDSVACTVDTCDAMNGCVFTANNANCNDTVACTVDTCDAMNDCVFTPNNALCNDSIACTADTCNAMNGCVFTPNNALCNDNVPCTDDTCSLMNGCVATANNANCNDTIACTTDVCHLVTDCTNYATDPACVELVITEIMQNPNVLADTVGEWFELVNLGPYDFDLTGCQIRDDGGESHTIGSLVATQTARLTFARTATPGFTPSYVYGPGTDLTNALDELVIRCGTSEATRVNWDDGLLFPDPTGASMTLHPARTTRSASLWGRHWCTATSSYNGDLGTPGLANDPCPTVFVMDLTGAQEVPAVATAALGRCDVILDRTQTQLTVSCTHGAVNPIAAHIHQAPVGVNGGIVFALGGGVSPIVATWPLSATDVTNLFAGNLYINVHTAAFPGGELRGQIVLATLVDHYITGAEQVPPVTTTAIGVCVHALPFGSSFLDSWCTHSAVSPTMAHIHQAPFGMNGGVVIGFASPVTPISNTALMSPALLTALGANELYVNVHTMANPGGELRGQIIP